MADTTDDKPNIWQPFTDIVGGQRDEGYVNLSNDIGKKISMPTDVKANDLLQYSASRGRYETVTLGTILNYQRAIQSADVTITTTTVGTSQDLTGATLTVSLPGTYRVQGIYDTDWTAGSAGVLAIGSIALNGGVANPALLASPVLASLAVASRVTITESWNVALVAGDVLTLRMYKSAAAGTLVAHGGTVGTGSLEIMRVSF